MNQIEQKFINKILPKYGKNRDLNYDKILIENNNKILNEENNILDVDIIREEFKYHVFSIDPPKCSDADDAFSIYEENENLFLAIHIADPTHLISLKSELWKDILDRGITRYPSNSLPIHMLPEEIVQESSLMTEKLFEKKRAISIIYKINKKTMLPCINEINLKFTYITVLANNKYTYKEASFVNNDIFNKGLQISKNLKRERSKETIGTKLSDIKYLSIAYDNNNLSIDETTDRINDMKEMIAEFAILTNSFIGEFIEKNIDGMGVYRTCNFDNCEENLSGEKILDKIIKDGVRGNYSENKSSHDLVGKELYCHFTSPLRRVTDCICHYIIKCYLLNKNNSEINKSYPWTKDDLALICKNVMIKNRNEKKIQFDDIKFRTIQLIHNLVKDNNIKLKVKVISYTGLFLNCIISKLIINNSEEYNIHISYTLRKRNLNITDFENEHTIEISKVQINDKFDEGTFEELDNTIYAYYS